MNFTDENSINLSQNGIGQLKISICRKCEPKNDVDYFNQLFGQFYCFSRDLPQFYLRIKMKCQNELKNTK